MGNRGWLRTGIILLALAASALSSCDKNSASSTAAQMATNPASLCASKETLTALTDVLFSNVDVSSNPATKPYVDQLKAGAVARIDIPVLDGYDKQINKVTCKGKLTVNWPNDISNKLKAVSPGSEGI